MSYTDEEFDKIFAALPEDVREAMTAVNTVNIMTAMKTKYNLHIDQLGELSAEVGMLMLGAIRPQEFIGKIESSLHIPNETAKLIATEVNEKIFRPVRESLMQIHKMKDAEISGTSKQVIEPPTKDEVIPDEIPEVAIPKDVEVRSGGDKSVFDEKPAVATAPKTSAPDPYREPMV